MTQQVVLPQDNSVPKSLTLSPASRVVDTFVAPSKTFEAVKSSPGWWFPFLLAVLVGVLYAFVVLQKVGLPDLTAGVIHQSASLEDRVAGATPEVAALIRSRVGTQLKWTLYLTPVLSLLIGLIASGILLASANFIAGGNARFAQMLGVWFYGTLPLTLFYLLVVVALFAGVGGEQFNLQNPIGTNIGFYLAGGESPKWLVAFLSSVDVFAIWTAAVLSIGVSTVAGIKRSSAAAIVVGWWVLTIALKVAGAAMGG